MELFQDAIAQLQSAEAGGFDFSPAQAATLLNEGAKRLAARSEWLKAERELGPTVALQELYPFSDLMVKLKALTVEGTPYKATDLLTLWDVKQGTVPTPNVGGFYVERFTDDALGERAFSVWPIPELDGQLLTGLAVMVPPDMTGEDKLPFPVEYNRAILDYAKAIAYEDIDENPQSGTYFMQRADARADELRFEGQSRVGGKRPFQVPVATSRRRRWR